MSGETERSEKGQMKKGLCWFEEKKINGFNLCEFKGRGE